MSEEKRFPGPPKAFRPVPISPVSGHLLRRFPSGAIVSPNGSTLFNANSSSSLGLIAHEAGLDPEQFSVNLGVDLEGQLVAVYPVPTGTPGASPVRIQKKGNAMMIHLSGVFKAHPSLKVEGRRQCAVTVETDASGVRCLVLGLQAALAKPRISRKKTEPTKATTETTKEVTGATTAAAAGAAPTETPAAPAAPEPKQS